MTGDLQPIGFGDARRLLEVMGGEEVPEEWRGGLEGLTYRLGPGMDSTHLGWKVRLVTNNYLEDKEDSNIIGIIRGEQEPDRWIHGGVDMKHVKILQVCRPVQPQRCLGLWCR